MEVIERRSNEELLKRAVNTAKEATWLDSSGEYDEALQLYQCTLDILRDYVRRESCQAIVDCVLTKMNTYNDRVHILRDHMSKHSPIKTPADSLDASSVRKVSGGGGCSVSSSSESGVYELDSSGGGTSSHNTSHDCTVDECDSVCAVTTPSVSPPSSSQVKPLRHQIQSRREFLLACEQQVTELLNIVQDEKEPVGVRDRAQVRCNQILEFAEAYRRDFCSTTSLDRCFPGENGQCSSQGTEDDEDDDDVSFDAGDRQPLLAPSSFARRLSATSSSDFVSDGEQRGDVPADAGRTGGGISSAHRHLVRAEVLVSASPDDDDTPVQVDSGAPLSRQSARADDGDDDYPAPPVDGDCEFRSCQNSLASVTVSANTDGASVSACQMDATDDTDHVSCKTPVTATAVRCSDGAATRKTDGRDVSTPDDDIEYVSASAVSMRAGRTTGNSGLKRRPSAALDSKIDERLSKPNIFWLILGSICG